MPIIGEFGAARREVKKQQGQDPDQFRFYGEVFTCADEVGVMPLLEFAAAAEAGTDAAEMRGLAAMHSLLQDCLVEEDWQRFRTVAKEHKADAETLLGICTKVYEVISGRPTVSQSDSPHGQSPASPSSSESSTKRAALGLVPVEQAGLLTG